MKKVLLIFALILVMTVSAFAFASCVENSNSGNGDANNGSENNGNENIGETPGGEDEHTHAFVDGKCECGEEDPNYVAPHEHDFVDGKCACGAADPDYVKPDEPGDEPGECEHSYVEGVCEKCGAADPDYVAPHEHTPAEATKENEVPATCSKEGSYDVVVYCSECKEELSRVAKSIEKIAHTEVVDEANAPTCTTTGLTSGKHCSVCNEVLEAQEVVDALGHTEGAVVVENNVLPDCVSAGSYENVVYCTVCSAELSREKITVDALGHTEGAVVVENNIAPDCVNAGSYENAVYCTVCSAELSREKIIVNALGHTEVIDEAVEPTCIESGLTAGKHCSVCEAILEAQTVVDALGHTPAEAVRENEIAATCAEEGRFVEVIYCSVCGAQISREEKVIEKLTTHNYEEGKCTICNIQKASDGLEFTSNGDGTCYVSGIGTCTDSNIIIPSVAPNGDKVISIGYCAFQFCTSFTSITIPGSIKSIGERAFYDCDSLTSVTIGNSVTSIGKSAFSYCTDLASVYITDIAAWCGISFGSSYANPLCYADNLYLNGELIVDLVIPEGVTTIPNYAFYGQSSIKTIVIPDSVTSIGEDAFAYCYGLTSVTIGNGVTSIGKSAFNNCTGLTSITIPDSVTSIGDSAFYHCASLTSITIPDSVTTLGYDSFNYCSSLTSVTIGNGVTSIRDQAFLNCSALLSVTIGSNVKIIGKEAFLGCFELASINIPDSVTNIEEAAFKNCVWLEEVNIGNGVTSIGSYAFSNCTGLTSVTIGNGVTSIGYDAFYNCTSLTSVTIPNSVTIIGSYAFAYCYGLTSVTIGNGVTSIVDYAFSDCTSLTSITIPDSVITIGAGTFCNCTSLENVILGNGVIRIEEETFEFCTSLASITIGNSISWIDDGAFAFCKGLENIIVNSSNGKFKSVDGNLYSKDGKTFILYASGKKGTGFIIPSNVTCIEASAFSDASNLTSVVIPASVNKITGYAFNNYPHFTIYCEASSKPNNWVSSWCNSSCSVVWGVDRYGVVSYGFVWIDQLDEIYIVGYSGNSTMVEISGFSNMLTKISDYAFYGCETLELVSISGGINFVGKEAFRNCKNLSTLIIHEGVSSIEDYTFAGCTRLTSITIPNSITSIGKNAFEDCIDLVSITVGTGVTKINDNAFKNCYKLVEIINHSSLDIEAGFLSNGYVGYYAKEVHTGESKIVNYNNYLFYTYKGVNYLLGYVGEDTALVFPESYNGENYEIYKYAFYEHSDITNVVVLDSVTNIADYAFYKCTSLQNATIGNSVTSIGERAFFGCTGLTSVAIGKGVTSIGKYAFYNCTGLTSVTIPDSVTSIGEAAFYECTGLTSVAIGNGVTRIGSYAFNYCTGLTSVYITDIAAWCKISFGDSYANPLCYADNLYLNGELIVDLVIPEGVTIPDYAFYKQSSIKTVVIPDSVCGLGESAFEGCAGLTSVVIPDSVTSIGERAFYNCTGLTSVKIGNGVTSIGERAFYYCIGLTSITVADGNTAYKSIDGNLYTEDGKTLIQFAIGKTDKSFVIPNGVTSIDYEAFYYCTGLTSVVIPDSVTSIGNYAFYYCAGLKSVTIGNGVTSIGSSAFRYCYKLVEIINHSSLDIEAGSSSNGDVGYYAIEVHTGESKIVNYNDYLFYTYNGINYLFGYVGEDTALVLPESYNGENYEIYNRAFYNRDDITSVVIPDSVCGLGKYAFEDCSSLTSVTFENPNGWWFSSSSTATSGTAISASDLSNTSTAATYLKSTCYNYYWNRS